MAPFGAGADSAEPRFLGATAAVAIRAPNARFRPEQSLLPADENDLSWVGSRLGADRGADSGFAPFAKIPTVRQPTAYRYISPDGEHRASAMRVLEMHGAGQGKR